MPTKTLTRRQKVEAMAAQSASPKEAKVAKAKLAVIEKPRLEAIAEDIMSSAQRGIEEEFRIGHLLQEAADLLSPKARTKTADGKQAGSPFGDWVRAQDFPFSMKTALRLRTAATREPEVRALIAEKSGRDMGVNTAVARLMAGPKPTGEAEPVTDTTPADPAYAAIRKAHQLLVEENGFESMHIDDMAKVAGFVQDIATSYKVEKAKRGA